MTVSELYGQMSAKLNLRFGTYGNNRDRVFIDVSESFYGYVADRSSDRSGKVNVAICVGGQPLQERSGKWVWNHRCSDCDFALLWFETEGIEQVALKLAELERERQELVMAPCGAD